RREKTAVLARADQRGQTPVRTALPENSLVDRQAEREPVVPERVNGRIERHGKTTPVAPHPQREQDYARDEVNRPCRNPLMPPRRVRHDDSRPAGGRRPAGGGFRIVDGHHAPFFRQARMSSSAVACAPSTACACRTASWASTCLNPSAINASTASLTRCSSPDRFRFALAAS